MIAFSLSELAGLPGLPPTPSGVRAFLRRKNVAPEAVAGRGGAFVYTLAALKGALPSSAREELERRGLVASDDKESLPAFDRASDRSRKAAARKERLLLEFLRLQEAGASARDAAQELGRANEVAPSTIWAWYRRVKPLPREQWRAALCHRAAGTDRQEYSVSNPFFALFYRDYWANQKQAPLKTAYRVALADPRVSTMAQETIPSEATVRRLLAKMRRGAVAKARGGTVAQRRTQPYQQRDRSAMKPLEVVTADGHTCDWLVEWEDGKRGRPELITFVDEYSGMILSHEIDRAENAGAVRRAAARMLQEYGTPDELRFDNGAGFSAKRLTGGAKNRFRGKDQEGELPGALPALGIPVRFIPPGSPESKGLQERSFGPIENYLRVDPALPAEAYMGNSPGSRSDVGGSEAVPIASFRVAIERAIERVNSMRSNGGCCRGRSRRNTFEQDGDSHLRARLSWLEASMCLMDRERVRPHAGSREIRIKGNRYWSEETAQAVHEFLATRSAKDVVVAYTPDAYHEDIFVLDHEGRLLGKMQCMEKSGYKSEEHARRQKALRRGLRRRDREADQHVRDLAGVTPVAVLERDAELRERLEKVEPEKEGAEVLSLKAALAKSSEQQRPTLKIVPAQPKVPGRIESLPWQRKSAG